MQIRDAMVLAGWLVGWWLLWRVPRLPRVGRDAPGRAVEPALEPAHVEPARIERAASCSVVIPARNEAASIANLLASLTAQTPAPGEIIVVDDRSEDDTAAIAGAFPGVRVLPGEPVPVGWTGKPWACHQGAHHARGTRLVFLDADVTVGDGGLDAVLDAHDRAGGLVSVQPFHHVARPYETLSAPFNIVGMMGVGVASIRPADRPSGAFGPCLVTGRDDYEAVGGHRSVRSDVAEDLALARRYRDSGRPVQVLGGGERLRFRMYPDGLRQLIEGWSKNVATGAGSLPVGRLLLIGWWITCLLLSVRTLVEAGWNPSAGRVLLAAGLYAAFVVQWRVMLRQLGDFGWSTALAFPVVMVAFVAIFARSAYLTVVRRRVAWRGRTVPVAGAGHDGVAAWP